MCTRNLSNSGRARIKLWTGPSHTLVKLSLLTLRPCLILIAYLINSEYVGNEIFSPQPVSLIQQPLLFIEAKRLLSQEPLVEYTAPSMEVLSVKIREYDVAYCQTGLFYLLLKEWYLRFDSCYLSRCHVCSFYTQS